MFRLDPLAGRPVHADIVVHSRPELRIMSAVLCGVSHGAAAECRAHDPSDELLFATALSGSSTVRQRGREVMLADGDGVLITRSDGGFNVAHAERVRFLGLRIPRSALAPLMTDVDDAVMRRIPRDAGALRLLTTYLGTVAEHRMLAAPEQRQLIVRHVHDLIALTVGATRDGATIAASRGLRAARLRAIESDIVAKLEDPELTVSSIASRHGVTPRYVHKLFERGGSTFSKFVLGRRLARAYRTLIDPRYDDQSISSVAFAVGFGDLSYFNRTFRRCYGATPSDVRRGRACPM